MPKVGKKHFAYTKKGVAAAKKEAKRVGKSLVYDTTKPMPKPKPMPNDNTKPMPKPKPMPFKKGGKYKIGKLGK